MPSQHVQLCNLTVFVGPNSSGKSLALTEIAQWAKPHESGNNFVVDQPIFTGFTSEQATDIIALFEVAPQANQVIPLGNMLVAGRNSGPIHTLRASIEQMLRDPATEPHLFRQFYVNNVTINLAVESRAQITGAKQFGDLLKPDHFNSYQVLFLNDELRREVQEILRRAFQRFFILDPSHAGHLRISFAKRPPSSPQEEQGFHQESRDYYASAESIDKFSAGVKAYTGTIVEVVAGNSRVVIIDEPEALLHPPLAQQLGKELATLAIQTRKNVFVATHSADFVMGCLHAGASADIIRLTYQNGTATARVLKNTELTRMMRNPLLRSAGVINALFYESVVVTESDADRAFYQEVNERLLKQGTGRGIPNCLFLNAQNKQTTKSIVKPLRELGIPTASIVDIDIFKEGGKVWSGHLESGFLPDLEMSSLATFRAALKGAVELKGLDLKRHGGVALLSGGEREAANNLFDRLDLYGLFTVRSGELESWLKHLGATGHSPEWLIKMFEKMGEDPSDQHYVNAGDDDVWSFMDRVAAWLQDPNRKGIPA
jgi:predicted ATPase